MGDKIKILVCGDVEGKFNSLFNKVENISKKAGAFDLLLCVGNFFGVNNKEFEPYKSGKKKIPVATYILGWNKEEHESLYPNEESEICENLFFLGKRGIYTSTGGLKIAYLSGIASDTSTNSSNYSTEDVIALSDMCHKGNPNFKGVDVLVTAQWPEGVVHDFKTMGNKDINFGTYYTSWLAMKLRPRYHVSGLEGIYYERPPYRNYDNDDISITTRFIGLARVGNPQKDKWIYALSLSPLNKMKVSELFQKTTDETGCPYNFSDLDAKVYKRKRKTEEHQQYFYDMSAPTDIPHKGKHKRKRVEFDQSKCWFCLASPSVEKHLIVNVGTTVYLAAAKGGLVDEHLLLCPIEHHQSSIKLNMDVMKEMENFKKGVRKYYESLGKLAVFFERNYKTSHMQVQAIPVPQSCADTIKELFMFEADKAEYEFQELESFCRINQVIPERCPYFLIEFPNEEKFFIKIEGSKGFPINFGRDVLSMKPVLNIPDRAEWKDCISSPDDEKILVKKLRSKFEPFEPT